MINKEQLEDRLADLIHEMWTEWMNFMINHKWELAEIALNESEQYPKETYVKVIMPKKDYYRWLQQMDTLYKDLTTEEQKSDIQLAQKVIELLENEDLLRPEFDNLNWDDIYYNGDDINEW